MSYAFNRVRPMAIGKLTFSPPPQRQRNFAKHMRASLTEAEKRLWWALRHRVELRNTHFRRQVAIGPYIADFCCLACRLVIEADGGQHYSDDAERRDAERSRVLAEHGFEILRFTNTPILTDMDSVMATIFAAISKKLAGHQSSIM